jgi:hypothetical protein
VASLALLLAAGGGAFAAVRSTGSAVNIVDATKPAQVAQVTASGAVKVSGSVTATESSASNFVRSFAAGVTTACEVLIGPPAGKALIVREVLVDTYLDPTPGPGNGVFVYSGAGCTGYPVLEVNPATIGLTVIPLEPGLVVPAGSILYAVAGGGVRADVQTVGYTVSASSMSGTTVQQSGDPSLNH